MSKILILSNGHGEDLSGSLIANQFVKIGYSVNALPIVGKGIHYEKEKIKIIGKTKEFSTGGIGYNSFKGRLTEIFRGEIIYLLKRLYLTYKIRKKYDYFFVVGDIVPLFFAWVCKKEFFTYLVAYSSHYEGKLRLPWPSKFFLLSQKAKKIYTRDSLTANDLTLQLKKKVSFLGNPFMDKFFFRDKELKKSEFSIGLFPGSRFPEILDNFVLILDLLEALSDLRYFQKIEFNFAIVNALSASKIKEILQNRKWVYLEKIKDRHLLKFQYKSLEVNIYWNNFDKILLKSRCCISMAGTAAEQAIGLGKPVIQIEGKGPQFTKSFAEAQRRLLGKYVFCASNYKDKKDQINQTIKLIIQVIYLIKLNNNFLISCNENAKKRLGENKACIKMVHDMNIVMNNDQGK
ncbi:MAG: lipid-A-disaccharide synthase-related protein [Prochlorococcus marinus CUG1439]|uniref:lipid-A-disaccharide synthase-related protein n=1 Tax=Prochlorococcus sp. MIT 1314 TaxID=3096220 RepID=UPI001AFD5FF4|nr:lipid-A-disaccharide synthase-related protein [Prochlorococcus sp. MIT 1314]MCR8539414.1 lipid-A-disaccharide synthase-related protein [Prochlorococcus marinus CUG1439]